MSTAKDLILKRLEKPEEPAKKQFLLSLRPELVGSLDQMVRAITRSSGQSVTRGMLIEDAVKAFLDDTIPALEERGIYLEEEETDAPYFDTVIFPAHQEGFEKAFLGENKWYYVRTRSDKMPKIKFCAIYVGQPTSAITHYAKVSRFVLDPETKKYIVEFDGKPVELEHPVPLGSAPSASTRAPRYTTLEKLLSAREYGEL